MYIMSANLSQFSSKPNLNMLWEVLLDELKVEASNHPVINTLQMIFTNNLTHFTNKANPITPVMELNKQFLSQVVLAFNKVFSENKDVKRIKISDEEVSSVPYKIEDIHSSRQTVFENEFKRKQIDMETMMTPQKPKNLDFSDATKDTKIKSMDSLVAQLLVERSRDIPEIQDSPVLTKDTAILEPMSRLKHIQIDKDNNVTLNVKEKELENPKKVTFKQENVSIFDKLKRDTTAEESEKQYEEQKSAPLPVPLPSPLIERDYTLRNQVTTLSAEPVIPKSELVKQLNEMNMKIDKLFDLVYKIADLHKIPDSRINRPEESIELEASFETL